MSRSLLTFLVFLAIFGLGFAVVGWWVGPGMLTLAVDEDKRGTPYYLVHLLNEGDPSSYFATFSELLREEQGQLLWRGGLAMLHSGRQRDEALDVAIIEFAAGADVVRMLTSSAYRELASGNTAVLLGSATAPGPIATDEVLLLWLLETGAELPPQALESLLGSVGDFDGQVIWSVPVDPLGGPRSWDRMLLLAFPSGRSVQAWLTAPRTATDRTLARRYVLDEALLELSASP